MWFASSEIAHLVRTDKGEVQLLHHFVHHDENNGLNDGADALWALMGGGDGAPPMVINTNKIHEGQLGNAADWSEIPKWDSTQAIRDATRLAFDGRKLGQRITELACRKKGGRSARVLLATASKAAAATTSSRGRPFKTEVYEAR